MVPQCSKKLRNVLQKSFMLELGFKTLKIEGSHPPPLPRGCGMFSSHTTLVHLLSLTFCIDRFNIVWRVIVFIIVLLH
jgi:hypothetical protein